MVTDNLTISISYLDFINSLDSILQELLYSDSNGYINLSSKSAVDEFENYISKFDSACEKLKNSTNFKNSYLLIEEKKTEFKNKLIKHRNLQVRKWAGEVFDKMIENCCFNVTVEKNNKIAELNYERGILACRWIAKVNNLNKDIEDNLVSSFNEKFKTSLNSTDGDFIPKLSPQKSDFETYLKLRKMAFIEAEKFNSLDFDSFSHKLSKEDLAFFKKLKEELLTFRATSIKDEFLLINSAIEILNLNKENEYSFIKDVENDCRLSAILKGKLDEQSKIDIVKRRMKLHKDKNQKNEYYKNLLLSD